MKAVKAYAQKHGLKLDQVRDDAETAALAGIDLPDLDKMQPIEMMARIDFATGRVSFDLG